MNGHMLVVSLQVQDVHESGRQSNEEGLALYPPIPSPSPAHILNFHFLYPPQFNSLNLLIKQRRLGTPQKKA